MYYKLKEQYQLRGWKFLPNAVVIKGRRDPIFISAKEMQALQLCSGLIDVSLPFISDEIREMLKIIEKNGVIEECEKGDSINPDQEYKLYSSRYIRTVHWSITGCCNYKCKHCYMSAPDAKYGQLSHEQVMDIAKQIIDCGIREVTLTGGEPLVRKDFFEIVDCLIEGGVLIGTIYSNGKLVTDEFLDKLASRGIHPEINMSYDGTHGWHDWLRGIDGAGKIAEDAFRRCRKKGFPTGAEMCVHQGNKHLIRETINHLSSLGCRSIKTNPISDVGAWKEGGYGKSMTIKELFGIYLDYIPEYYEDGMPLYLQLGGFFMASPKKPESYIIPSLKSCGDPEKVCVCGHARQVMYISAEGRALPCMSLSGMDIQKNYPLVTETGLVNCITDSSYMSLIETRASVVLEHNEDCRKCEFAKSCLGGCRASALETTPDDIFGKDEACCEIFRGGWTKKIDELMKKIKPEATRPGMNK